MEIIELTPISPDALRAEVSAFYAERVRTQGSCCGTGAGDCVTAYADADLALAPAESAAISYGCGNPGAIAALQPGEVVLDMGSGGGLDCFLAAEQVGPDGFVYGVDMTDEMLAVARAAAQRQGRGNVEFRKGVIEALPVEDERVDVIISNCVLNLSPDKPAAFGEAFRVLRPGGRLAISDIVIDGALDDLPVSEQQVRAALSWSGCIAGALTVAELQRDLAAAGFTEIVVEPRFHYRLADLVDDHAQTGLAGMTPTVAAELASRFASADIRAVKPRRA